SAHSRDLFRAAAADLARCEGLQDSGTRFPCRRIHAVSYLLAVSAVAVIVRSLNYLIRPLSALVRSLQTDRIHLTAFERLTRGMLLVPLFGTLLVMLRTASACGLRLAFEATTVQGNKFRCHPPDLVQMYLWLFDVWEPDLTDLIARHLRKGDGF